MEAEHDDSGMTLYAALPKGVFVDEIVDGCREAFVSFCRGVASGWTKRDLASWLAGPYARVARLVDWGPPASSLMRTSPKAMALLNADRIGALLDPAWQGAISCIEALAAGTAQPFDEALARGSVIEAMTADDQVLWVPMHMPGLPLAVRVRSLIVADYLMRPEDYEGDVIACGECGMALLGRVARRRGYCLDHVFNSDVRLLGDAPVAEELMPIIPRAAVAGRSWDSRE
jgi:hypothetical protein